MAAISTHVFHTVGDLALSLDVIKPNRPPLDGRAIALVHFHGGFLVVGEKSSRSAQWLINACRRRGWTFVSPAYRLLPEANGADIVDDAVAAVNWVRENISPEVIISGSSAGGYVAFAAAANVENRQSVLGLLSIYGMVDPCGPRYTKPGNNLLGHASVDTSRSLQSLKDSVTNGKVLDGYPLPERDERDQNERWQWIAAMHQEALYPDILTGVEGMAKQIRARGIGAIPHQHRKIFPVLFGLTEDFPPTVLLHGDKDTAVPQMQSNFVADRLSYLGARVLLEIARGCDHGFDRDGLPEDIDIDDSRWDGNDAVKHLRSALTFITKNM